MYIPCLMYRRETYLIAQNIVVFKNIEICLLLDILTKIIVGTG
jgi:hypothetical protein